MNRTRLTPSVALAFCGVFALAGCTSAGPTSGATTTRSTASAAPAATSAPPSTPAKTPAVEVTTSSATSPSPQPTASAEADTVAPALTYAGAGRAADTYEVSGLVPGIIEDGGSCTFHLRSGGTSVDRTQQGVADATSTSCGTVVIPASALSSGTWVVTLEYSSGTHHGTSPEQRMDVK